METSSRNSEVIHAGIYYPPGSLKARMCVQGRGMLYEYAQARQLPHRRIGKLVVASSEAQLPKLRQLAATGAENGVRDLEFLSRSECLALEPSLHAVAGLLSPSTGVIDSHSLMQAMQADLEEVGGMLSLNTRLKSGKVLHDDVLLLTVEDTVSGERSTIQSRWLINCAGLHAHTVAGSIKGIPNDKVPAVWYAKGNYFSLSGRCPFSRLVYPMPEKGGLGAHLTLDLNNPPQAKFGPDVEWLGMQDPDTIDYDVQPARLEAILKGIRAYWPGVPVDALQPSYSGVRVKLSVPDMPASDFHVQTEADHGLRGVVNLYGIESPGLTSSLALGSLVRDLVMQSSS